MDLPVNPHPKLSSESKALLGSLDKNHLQSLRAKLGGSLRPGHELVASALKQCSVDRLSGICGTPADRIFSSVQKQGIRVLGFRRQDAAVIAAAADNYSSRRLAHANLVSAGPAITNTCTGVLFAQANRLPVLLLGTRRSLIDEGCGYFQEFDAVPMMKPLVKYAATVRHASDLVPMISDAIRIAVSDEPGPVFLDIPENVISEEAVLTSISIPKRTSSDPKIPDIEATLAVLRSARRPLICIGEGVHWEADAGAVRRFVEREGIPFVTTSLARGFVSESHPLCVTSSKQEALLQADTILLAGAWFDWRFRMGAELNRDATIVHVHNNPAELGRNVECHLEIPADPGKFLNEISALPGKSARSGNWVAEFLSNNPGSSCPTSPAPYADLYRLINDSLSDDTMITVDGNQSLTGASSQLRISKPASFFDPGLCGLIGGSLPLAMGFQLANPRRPVVALISDTSFGMSGMEWETCVRHGLNIVGIVANNHGNTGTCRDQMMFSPQSEKISSYTPGIQYDQIAKSLGTHHASLNCANDIPPAIKDAQNRNWATCINVDLPPDYRKPSPHKTDFQDLPQ